MTNLLQVKMSACYLSSVRTQDTTVEVNDCFFVSSDLSGCLHHNQGC